MSTHLEELRGLENENERLKKQVRALERFQQQERDVKRWAVRVGTVTLALIGAGMYGCPQYKVWEQGMDGQAKLRSAEQTRQIEIEAAKARRESAKYDAEARIAKAKADATAEVERARGAAQATSIIGDSLKGYPEYMTYLKIEALNTGQGDRIYIPTEAGLPILEARK